jgi:uncharacterized protein (DUF302 family)
MSRTRLLTIALTIGFLAIGAALFFRQGETISDSRFLEPDRLFAAIEANVRARPEFEVIVDIDHARLGAESGSPMPPSHVLIWSDPALDAAILQHNPQAAVDLPLRALAYEDQATGSAAVIFNSYAFLQQRHALPDDAVLEERYAAAMSKAVSGIPEGAIGAFASDALVEDNLVTFASPFDFASTEQRVREAIKGQSDTVNFGTVDFAARAASEGVALDPLLLILFGGPAPGGKAMASAPTLGLDAFCQKLIIWTDSDGTVKVSFNDLLALAERQDVSAGLPLRVINRRMKETFSTALEP